MFAIFLPPIRYIYFDFDNVLAHRAGSRSILVARMLGLPDAVKLREFYFVGFREDAVLEQRYDSLRTVEEEVTFYADLFQIFCDRERVTVEKQQLQGAARAFVRVPMVVANEVPACLATLRQRYTLGILTNGLPSRHQEIIDSRLNSYFQNIVISSDYRMEKPAPKLYEIAAKAAAVPLAKIAFVDDEPANVAGAEQAGFGQAILFTPAFWRQVQ